VRREGMITGIEARDVGCVYGLIHNQAWIHGRIQSR